MYKNILFRHQAVHYQVEGEGKKVIVLLHGFPESGTIFHQQTSFLAQDCKVIVPDLPGVGKSPYNNQLQSVDDFAEAVYHILKEEHIEQCILVGHSMGGYIALAFAEKYEHTLSGLGLLHSHPFAEDDAKKDSRRKSIKFLQENDNALFLKTMVPNLFATTYKEKHADIVENIFKQACTISNEALIRFQEIMIRRTEKTKVLQELKVPVLFILGNRDLAAPLESVITQVTLPSNVVLRILDNVAHMGMYEATHEVNKQLHKFIHYA